MTEIERAAPSPPTLAGPTRGNTLELAPAAWSLAQKIAATSFVPEHFKNKPHEIMSAMLTAHELGIEPMTGLNKINVIKGKPTLAAELMRAVVQNAGHKIRIIEMTGDKAVVEGIRADDPDHVTRVTWTLQDARNMGLLGRDAWKKQPRVMLVARATSELCRFAFADCLAGMSYTPEEMEDGLDTLRDAPREATLTVAPAEVADADPDPEVIHPPTVDPDPDDDIAEAEVVDVGAGAADDDGPRLTGPQRIAVMFQDMDITDRSVRLQMTSTIIGREISSGNELTPEEVATVIAALQEEGTFIEPEPEADEVAPEEDDIADAEVIEPDDVEEDARPDDWTGDEWRAATKVTGKKATAVLKKARELAGSDRKVGTLDSIAGLGIGDDLYAWMTS